jgi:hypothetical protein
MVMSNKLLSGPGVPRCVVSKLMRTDGVIACVLGRRGTNGESFAESVTSVVSVKKFDGMLALIPLGRVNVPPSGPIMPVACKGTIAVTVLALA